jgi:hypothetical protein
MELTPFQDLFSYPTFDIQFERRKFGQFPEQFPETCFVRSLTPSNPTLIKLSISKVKKAISALDCLSFSSSWDYWFCDGSIEQRFSASTLASFSKRVSPKMLAMMKKTSYIVGAQSDKAYESKWGGNQYYITETFGNGDFCKDNGMFRETIVNYRCGLVDKITNFSEFAVCRYRMTVEVKKLCDVLPLPPVEALTPLICPSDRAFAYQNQNCHGSTCFTTLEVE